VGYKVGCTSDSIRRQFGLTEPINGRLMSPHIETDGAKFLSRSNYVNCAIEPEMVICIGRDLTGERLADRNIVDSLVYISAGIEVHHFKFWLGDPTVQVLIMFNGLFACLVMGSEKVKPDVLDFRTEIFEIFKNGSLVTQGTSSQIMGGPLNSLKWLVSHLAKRGETLRTGQFVIPGSPIELVPITEDTDLSIRISKVGVASAQFVS
jgi:2-keto-4-pentenoate hydratase